MAKHEPKGTEQYDTKEDEKSGQRRYKQIQQIIVFTAISESI